MLQQMSCLEDAKRIAAAARAEADRNGWHVVIAILDDGGHLMYLNASTARKKDRAGSPRRKTRRHPAEASHQGD